MHRSPFRLLKKPSAARCLLLVLSAFVWTSAYAADPVVLEPRTIAELTHEHAPRVAVARARVEEARALHVGARAWAGMNPEITAYAGPRWYTDTPRTTTAVDVSVGVMWPFDFSSTTSKRAALADERTRAAETESSATERAVTLEAMQLWIAARSAQLRVALESERLTDDETMVRAVEVRRRAGTVGDGDVAIATLLHAQAIARKSSAEGDVAALTNELRGKIGLSVTTPVTVDGELVPLDPPALDLALARISSAPAIARTQSAVRVAHADVELQQAIIVQPPRLVASGGREQETYAHLGLDVPVPIFQRNQTNEAVAEARSGTAATEVTAAKTSLDADLRAAYARYEAARTSFRALDASLASIADAEHLALRSYELGQSTLMDLVAVRRETFQARVARLDSLVMLARARLAIDAVTLGTP